MIGMLLKNNQIIKVLKQDKLAHLERQEEKRLIKIQKGHLYIK